MGALFSVLTDMSGDTGNMRQRAHEIVERRGQRLREQRLAAGRPAGMCFMRVYLACALQFSCANFSSRCSHPCEIPSPV